MIGTIEHEKRQRALMKQIDAQQKKWKFAHYSDLPTAAIERKILALHDQMNREHEAYSKRSNPIPKGRWVTVKARRLANGKVQIRGNA